MRTLGKPIVDFARRLVAATSASAAVEMCFIAPILVFLGAGMVDLGLGFYTRMICADAAQAGAAYAQLNASNYSTTPCTSNTTPCTWDTAVEDAAVKGHSTTTVFATLPGSCTGVSNGPVCAVATVEYCCISSGVVATATCTQAGTAGPSCGTGNPTYGTYTQVVVSVNYSTILPYSYVSNLFNLGLNISNPITLSSTYMVRVQ